MFPDAMGGGGDANGGRPVPWRKPWWRSVGFWVGMWGLAFLVWVGVDSYANTSRVVFPVTVEAPGYGATDAGSYVMLEWGRVSVGGNRIVDPPMGMTVSKGSPVATYKKGTSCFPVTSWWGADQRLDEPGNPFAGMPTKVWMWFFHYGVVVVGYGGVWVSLMMVWRRWMRRRWEKVVVEG